MPRPPETFTTARLLARPPRVDDAEAAFAAYAADPEVTRFLSWRYYTEIEPLREFLRGAVRTWETGAGSHFPWKLFLRDTDRLVGSIGVSFDQHGAMLGYVLGRAHWGQGLMTEAVRYVAAWALAQPPIYRVWAFCDAENPASARVMEKAGLEREGLLRRWHVCPTIGPEPRDCLIYAKVR
jgi:RimJ/RimL family protein N-acetyltransferase